MRRSLTFANRKIYYRRKMFRFGYFRFTFRTVIVNRDSQGALLTRNAIMRIYEKATKQKFQFPPGNYVTGSKRIPEYK